MVTGNSKNDRSVTYDGCFFYCLLFKKNTRRLSRISKIFTPNINECSKGM